MIVSITSVRGAPGVTSWALLLAAAWPAACADERIVVEADVDGGVTAARYGVGSSPGVAQLLSSVRGGAEAPADVEPFARRLGGGGWLIPGPESAEAARSLWSAPGSAADAAMSLERDARLWVVDAGRAGPDSPLVPVLRSSSVVLVLATGDHASVVQLPSRARALHDAGCRRVVVAVSGSTPFATDEIAELCAAPVVGVAADPRLTDLAGAVWHRTRARRTSTWRSAVTVSATVADLISPGVPSSTSGPAEVSDAG